MPKPNHRVNCILTGISGKFFFALFFAAICIKYVEAKSLESESKDSLVLLADEKINKTTIVSGKIFIVEGTVTHNLLGSETTEIVYIKKKLHRKKIQIANQNQKKSKKPSQPPMVNKDSETDNSRTVLSFTSKGKMPSALFYSGKTSKAAIVNSGSFVVKSFPPKKAYDNIIHTLLLNEDNQQIKTSFAGILPKPQIHLEEHITRPPPFWISSLC